MSGLPLGGAALGAAGGGGAGPSAAEAKRKLCNCRNSRCLKLYCECFASGQYCFGCNCQGCHNNPENDDKRKRAIEATLERNPQAFRPKIGHARDSAAAHNRGCHCKKSGSGAVTERFEHMALCGASSRCWSVERSQEVAHGAEERGRVHLDDVVVAGARDQVRRAACMRRADLVQTD